MTSENIKAFTNVSTHLSLPQERYELIESRTTFEKNWRLEGKTSYNRYAIVFINYRLFIVLQIKHWIDKEETAHW